MIQCYAPTADKADDEVEQLYKEVEQVITETLKRNIIFITGDFNARVGKNAEKKDVVGRYGHGERNDRGQTLETIALYKLTYTIPYHTIGRRLR